MSHPRCYTVPVGAQPVLLCPLPSPLLPSHFSADLRESQDGVMTVGALPPSLRGDANVSFHTSPLFDSCSNISAVQFCRHLNQSMKHQLIQVRQVWIIEHIDDNILHCTSTGWPNKNRTFFRYHIFAATTDIIMRFLLKCSEITAENKKQKNFLTSVKYSLQSNRKWTTSYETAGR